ncbi:MAG: ubiquitin-conjugating enzyme E2 [Candidatus Freyarchaeota archaeon]|nr:ubiquitin-conjugating enzyme E2 [Candidatus Jordarchaeia archaeon]
MEARRQVGGIKILSDEQFNSRLVYEAKMLEKEEPTFKPVDGDLTHWKGVILGTGVYDGGVFEIEIFIPRDYPFKPPKIQWNTPIWHPNVRESEVCIGILGKDWTPNTTIVGVIEALRVLLNFPNPYSPFNTEAADQMLNDKKKFKKKVREWVEKYANWKKVSEG